MRILIADDDPAFLCLVEGMLRKWGYDVLAVSDGEAAWVALNGAYAPPLAILDWVMPGMDGVAICRRARTLNVSLSTYIILLTVRDSQRDAVNGLDAGANDYIVKPFDPEELRARVQVGVRVIELQTALAERLRDLQDAVDHVKRLQGLLPICSKCHRIRDDRQVWQRLETYLQEHSEIQLSHGYCPECLAKEMSESGLLGNSPD